MQRKFTSQSAPARRGPWLAVVFRLRRLGEGGFVSLRVLIAFGGGGFSSGLSKAQAQLVTANSPNGPELVPLVGPVCVNTDLRDLPYIPPVPQILRHPVTRYARAKTGGPR